MSQETDALLPTKSPEIDYTINLISHDVPGEEYDDDDNPTGRKQVGDFTVFGNIINSIVGTGCFSLPNAFYQSGIPFSLLLMTFCATFSIIGAIYTLEMSARARGHRYARQHNLKHTKQMNKLTFVSYEFGDVMEEFLGKGGNIFSSLMMSLYVLGSIWGYAAMFGSAAANLFSHYLLRSSTEYSILFLYLVLCRRRPRYGNSPNASVCSAPTLLYHLSFALNCALTLPGLIQPLKHGKKRAALDSVGAMIISVVIFLTVGITSSLAIGPNVYPYVIMNYSHYGKFGFAPTGIEPVETWYSTLLKLVIMLFPMINTLSAAPIVTNTLTSALFPLLPRTARERAPVLFYIVNFIVSIIPFILALLFPNMGVVVDFCGLSAVFIGIIIPAIGHLASKHKCKPESKTPYSGFWSHSIVGIILLVYGFAAFAYNVYYFIYSNFIKKT
ncbi:hypothetical protein BLNAU_15870 [Blattamonas nauphoetae]|uniref:Amino acid transporter transmembrane domain-containing protein n=1 Tax=Blattamonas nauphoetae TaxID=2049346 RepID=A0ABQ9XBS2_9EUKA|nr:hypothetical protein BLNAU_15870 [Blattamonas nauphoetae]